jgi:hypothetical protein
MKYIFVAGAPGSKWSSVVKNIYYSASLDQTDYSETRTYHHDADGGVMHLMHLGAYYDPGMEFGDWFDKINERSKEECEREFDRPFSGQGIRIIKSHVFCHHIDFLKRTWPDCPVVLVHRSNDACLGWWVRCGHFDITYPSYAGYYKNLKHMARTINQQNADLLKSWHAYQTLSVEDNHHLCDYLDIQYPGIEYRQNYDQKGVNVGVIR